MTRIDSIVFQLSAEVVVILILIIVDSFFVIDSMHASDIHAIIINNKNIIIMTILVLMNIISLLFTSNFVTYDGAQVVLGAATN